MSASSTVRTITGNGGIERAHMMQDPQR